VIGSQILHYQITRQLGEGGMGIVYEALDTWLERTVALKFLHESKRMSLAALRGFAREAKIAAQLDHPNIGIVYALERSEEDVFLAMAYYQGQSLDTRLAHSAIPVLEVMQYALEIAKGLEHAHLHGVVHRDVKPSNIFLAQSQNGTSICKILDFGLSKLGERSTVQSINMVGTPEYMAPEQLDSKSSSKSDLWAWGAVVYEMLSGVSPFGRESMVETFQALLLEEPIPLETRGVQAPDVLLNLVQQCLQKDPDQRPLDARELVRALSQPSLSNLSLNRQSKFLLPVPPTAFIGREHELQELFERFQSTRLVTITAAGGMGKTRLALEYARIHQLNYSDHAYFVDLAKITDANLVANAILEAVLGVGGENPKQRLLQELEDKKSLLVLDNFEHLMPASGFVAELLGQTNHLHLLITSRQTLGLKAETVFGLMGLEAPKSDFATSHAALLFTRVAQRFDAHFNLQPEDTDLFNNIFVAVNGMPLGLELAASWLRSLSLEEIATELQRNTNFLTSQDSTTNERHRSMSAVFSSSWDLLSAPEQNALAQLTIFQGGFDRDLARTVCQVDMVLLQHLVSKSLLYKTEQHFRFHELIRQQAAQRLPEAKKQGLLENLVDECLSVASNWYNKRQNGQQHQSIFTRLTQLTDNFRLALEWSLEHQPRQCLEIFLVLGHYWSIRGNFKEALYWREKLRQHLQFTSLENLLVETLYVRWLDRTGKYREGVSIAQNCLEQAIALNEPVLQAQLHLHIGQILMNFSDLTQAKQHVQKAVRLFRHQNQTFGSIEAINSLGVIHNILGNLKKARSSYQETIQICQDFGEERVAHLAAINIATVDLVESNTILHLELFTNALEYVKKIKDLVNCSESYSLLGYYEITTQNYREAKQCFLEALHISSDYQNEVECSFHLLFLGFIAAFENRLEKAKQLLSAANQLNPNFTNSYYSFELFAKRLAENNQISQLWEESKLQTISPISLEIAVRFAFDQ
jgi:serine/threonine protein kinase/tetratricopeptide (TPR) repeat protein